MLAHHPSRRVPAHPLALPPAHALTHSLPSARHPLALSQDVEYDDKLKKELVMSVRDQIGAFAAPDVIHWAPGLPKTRSGNIMRRVLRKIAAFEED